MPQTIKFKEIWRRYNIWISGSVFVLVVAAAWLFVLIPIRANIENNSDEMQKKVIDRDMYLDRIAKIPDMEETRSVIAENESSLRVFLNKNSEVDFIKKIESVAEETGNKVELKIADGEGVQKPKAAVGEKAGDVIKKSLPKIPYLSMSISLEGNYEQALNFLHKIENMNYYVDVISLKMSKNAIEAIVDPFATEKKKAGVITSATEIIKSNLDVVVYLEK